MIIMKGGEGGSEGDVRKKEREVMRKEVKGVREVGGEKGSGGARRGGNE